MTKNDNLVYRLEQAEKRVEQLDSKLDDLLTNHIPHLREDVLSLKTRVNIATSLNIGAIIIGIIVSKMI